ncbi:MAG: hypothetical protein H6841_02970 [Planctomycetes bacterium]|nr:hypothetical protein [Planctomycetota bacterium]
MPEIKCKVECPCGWTEVFSRAYSGLLIECPRCGKSHRIPTFDAPDADAAIDMSTMKKLLDQPSEPRVSVLFKPLLLLTCAVALVAICVSLPLLWNRWPVNVAAAGGALAWPLAVSVAWLGQARQRNKARGEKPDR